MYRLATKCTTKNELPSDSQYTVMAFLTQRVGSSTMRDDSVPFGATAYQGLWGCADCSARAERCADWQKAYFGIMRARKYGSVWESKGNSLNKYFFADIHVYCIQKLKKKTPYAAQYIGLPMHAVQLAKLSKNSTKYDNWFKAMPKTDTHQSGFMSQHNITTSNYRLAHPETRCNSATQVRPVYQYFMICSKTDQT